MHNDSVSVPRQTLFNLASHIHTIINCRKFDLEQMLKSEEASPFAKSLARSLNIKSDINDLNGILDLVLDCAPDDIKDFFTHYDEICAKCPF